MEQSRIKAIAEKASNRLSAWVGKFNPASYTLLTKRKEKQVEFIESAIKEALIEQLSDFPDMSDGRVDAEVVAKMAYDWYWEKHAELHNLK